MNFLSELLNLTDQSTIDANIIPDKNLTKRAQYGGEGVRICCIFQIVIYTKE